MFGKLLKHEFRATGRIMLPLLGGLVLLGGLTNLSLQLMSSSNNGLLNALCGIVIFLFVVACFGAGIMAIVTMVVRFRQSMLSDEGYLTHTLPVSVHQLIWSRLIVALVFLILTMIALAVSILLAVYQVGMLTTITKGIVGFLQNVYAAYAWSGIALTLETLALCLAGALTSCLIFYAAMSIGHSFANHKNLLSVVFFFALEIGSQILGTLVVALVGYTTFFQNLFVYTPDWTAMSVAHIVLLVFVIGAAALGAIYYVLTALMLKRRLNLQ